MFETSERVAERGGALLAAPVPPAARRLYAVLSAPAQAAPPPQARLLAPVPGVRAMTGAPPPEAPPPSASPAGTHPAVALLQRAVTLVRLAEAAQGAALAALAGFDRARDYAVEHPELGAHPHASAGAFLHHTVGIGSDDARGRVRLAGRLAPTGDLAPVGDLLRAGRTTLAHCRAVAQGVRGLDPDVVAASLPAICTLTEHLDPVALARELRERAHAVSDTLAREQEKKQRERRGFWFPRSTDGVAHPKGQLEALDADVLEEALERVMARQRRALDDAGHKDTRDLAQRRADALVELARHALASDDVTGGGPLLGTGGVRAAVTVVVTAERLAGAPEAPAARTTSSAQTVLSTGTLLRLTCDADVSRLVLDPDGGVLDLGRQTRTVSPSQWRALVGRDRTCVIRGCHRPAAGCQAHHVQHWSRGGPSDLSNYALVCHQHHHEIHDDEKLWHRHRDGRWITPDGYRPADDRPPPLSRLRYPDLVSPAPRRSEVRLDDRAVRLPRSCRRLAGYDVGAGRTQSSLPDGSR